MDNFNIDDYAMDEEKYSKDIQKCDQVFVYGTLKTGGEIRGLNNMGLNVNPKGKANTSYSDYEMIDLGAFPGLLKGNSTIIGEVWELDEEALYALDGMEGFERNKLPVDWKAPNFGDHIKGNFYSRTLIQTSQGKAWIYFLDEQTYGKYRDLESNNIEKVDNTLIWHN
tara:strand:- start:271 stop:774 length:504 start_codon:yes stop_codon:yes gene_type:complete